MPTYSLFPKPPSHKRPPPPPPPPALSSSQQFLNPRKAPTPHPIHPPQHHPSYSSSSAPNNTISPTNTYARSHNDYRDVSPLGTSRFESAVSPFSKGIVERQHQQQYQQNNINSRVYNAHNPSITSSRLSNPYASNTQQNMHPGNRGYESGSGGQQPGQVYGVDEKNLGIVRGEWNRANFAGGKQGGVGSWEYY